MTLFVKLWSKQVNLKIITIFDKQLLKFKTSSPSYISCTPFQCPFLTFGICKIHEMLFLRQSQQNQGSLLLLNVSKTFVFRREHILWTHLLQQSQKMHFCFLPIILAFFSHLYTAQSGQDQYKFLFLVRFSNSVLLRPEHLRWYQTLAFWYHLFGFFLTPIYSAIRARPV